MANCIDLSQALLDIEDVWIKSCLLVGIIIGGVFGYLLL